MEYLNTWMTFVEYSPLPRPEEIVEAFVRDAHISHNDIRIENPLDTGDHCWVFEMRYPAYSSVIRVSSHALSDPVVREFLMYLTARVADLETTEGPRDGLDHPNTPEHKQAVLDHLNSTKYIVQTTLLLPGDDNNAWDVEYGVHICLGRLSTSNTTGVVSFYNEGDRMSFADEVCIYLEFQDPAFSRNLSDRCGGWALNHQRR